MKKKYFLNGLRDGLPIGLGYLSVGFSVGIACRNAGLDALQGFIISLLNNASSGEYAGLTVISGDLGILSIIIMMLIVNARYLLMSCALSQKLRPDTPLKTRLLMGYEVTDELFGLAIGQEGYVEPSYYYGAMCATLPCWSSGTALGVIAGNLMSEGLVSACSVMLFGMFIAVIIPAGKKDKVVLGCIIISFIASFAFTMIPYISTLSEGMRTIILTVVISSIAAVLFPRKEENS